MMVEFIHRSEDKRVQDINPHRVSFTDFLDDATMPVRVLYRINEQSEYLRKSHNVHPEVTPHYLSFYQTQQGRDKNNRNEHLVRNPDLILIRMNPMTGEEKRQALNQPVPIIHILNLDSTEMCPLCHTKIYDYQDCRYEIKPLNLIGFPYNPKGEIIVEKCKEKPYLAYNDERLVKDTKCPYLIPCNHIGTFQHKCEQHIKQRRPKYNS